MLLLSFNLLLAQSGGNTLTQTQMWLLIILAGIGLAYVTVVRPMMSGKRKDPLDRPSKFASLSQHRNVERDMENLLVELSKMARQITGQLDTRAQKLELLMKEADEKIKQLQSIAAAGNGSADTHRQVPTSSPAPEAAPETNDDPDPRHAEVYALADQGRDAFEIASQLGRPRGEVELILALRGKAEG